MLAAAVLVCGCGKRKTEPAATPADAAVKSSGTPLQGTVDPQLTSLLKKFVQEKGRMPGSILELAGATTDSIPRPPEGFAYAIDPATTEVKLVKR